MRDTTLNSLGDALNRIRYLLTMLIIFTGLVSIPLAILLRRFDILFVGGVLLFVGKWLFDIGKRQWDFEGSERSFEMVPQAGYHPSETDQPELHRARELSLRLAKEGLDPWEYLTIRRELESLVEKNPAVRRYFEEKWG